MSSDPIAALRASHERLRATVAPLTPEQIRQPAYPSEWSIAQVLSHLGSGAEINGLVVDAGVAGSGPVDRAVYPPIWDTWNAKSPDEMAADGLASDAATTAKIESLAGSAARFHTFAGETDINGLAAGRLSEHAVHTWDVLVAVQPGATLTADAVEIILPGLARFLGWVAKPKNWTGRIHVTTTDPAGEHLLVLGESSTFGPWDGGAADARLSLPGEAFIRLVYGRLDAANTPAGVEADGVDLDELRSAFPGF